MSGTNGAGSLAVSAEQIANYPPGTATALAAKLTQGAWKEPVRLASNGGAVANLSAVTVANFDGTGQGVTLNLNDRVLVKDTASPDGVIAAHAKYNGWYLVGAVVSGLAALTRDLDADADPKVNSGDATFISEGALAGKVYLLTTANPIALGTTALTFSAFATATGGVLPNPTGAGKLAYDTGAAWAETAAGTTHQLLHGAVGAPTWGAVDLATEVSGLLPDANISPAANGFIQVIPDAGTMVAGSLVVSSGITVRAGSKFLAIRNLPDVVAAHWGKLSTGSAVVGGPGVGSITITSSNALDTSSITLLIFG